ncbi:MAG TPA: hypothetical protein VFH58_16875 [Acidimicrobiales bacterium]|nr:hypothetical protein [Acidimicrobiales bacterium]
MSVYETVGRNQKQALLALHHGNEAVLDVMKPFMTRTEPVRKVLRELPYVDTLPTARETAEQWFGFVEDVLKEEHAFVLHVIDMLPDHREKTSVVKATPKAA